jgi:hypothetical protein
MVDRVLAAASLSLSLAVRATFYPVRRQATEELGQGVSCKLVQVGLLRDMEISMLTQFR